MAVIGANAITLLDIQKSLDPDGKPASIIELLSQTNQVIDDMVWQEANGTVGHQMTVQTGLPTVAWRLYNQGTPTSKGTKAQINEGIGMCETWSEIDEGLAQLSPNIPAFRLQESRGHIAALNIEMAETMFYGNSGISPEEFSGLSVRYSDLSAQNARNIINGGGSGSNNTSIWLGGWGDHSLYSIYPKGSVAGLKHEDYGVVTVETTAGIGGARMRAYQERWEWKMGIALADWRYVVRIANIDVPALIAKTSAADLIELMINAINKMESFNGVKAAFYMNRTVFHYLDVQRYDNVSSGGGLTYMDVDGKNVPSFRGIPIRIVDALLNTEATVS